MSLEKSLKIKQPIPFMAKKKSPLKTAKAMVKPKPELKPLKKG